MTQESPPESEYDMSEMDEYYARTRRPLFQNPTTFIGRIGCGALVVLWFMILLLPCALFWLATGNDLVIGHGADVPEPEQHPLVQVDLIMEARNRGLKLQTTSLHPQGENTTCVEGHITYFLWESDASAVPAQYCQCYTREAPDASWTFIAQASTTCDDPPLETAP